MNLFTAEIATGLALTRVQVLHEQTIKARINHQFLPGKYASEIAAMEKEAAALQAELDRVKAYENAVEKVLNLREKLREALGNIKWLKDDIAAMKDKERNALPKVY